MKIRDKRTGKYKKQYTHWTRFLGRAENTGKVIIRRKDGRPFALIPEKTAASPLDVPTIKTKITTKEIVEIIREGRER